MKKRKRQDLVIGSDGHSPTLVDTFIIFSFFIPSPKSGAFPMFASCSGRIVLLNEEIKENLNSDTIFLLFLRLMTDILAKVQGQNTKCREVHHWCYGLLCTALIHLVVTTVTLIPQ